jgi:hypothetical protein
MDKNDLNLVFSITSVLLELVILGMLAGYIG